MNLLQLNREDKSVDANRNPHALHHVHYPSDSNHLSSRGSWHRRDNTTADSGDDSDGVESTSGSKGTTEFNNLEGGDAIWIPPEAADKEDETDHMATYIDDDDECDDGINWGQSSFSPNGKDSEPSPNPREGRQRAMIKAMNGQLKILVSRFLASADISFPQGEDRAESWLDIVTSLSWEAALLIKPDGSVGKEMDPVSYIKVKCVAFGTRRQCEVIKGLVFKKNAAHKHMPTKCHNPKLLLLRGVLGHSDVGLSSFNSIQQEKDHLENSISQIMEVCSPNVIMVEKTVSRNIRELLVKEGVTLVLDMKLNRLQRIARCSGSPIVSFSEVLSKTTLKQCDYFHIEKVVEEHNHTGGSGKRPTKTLMFLEGFPKPLGCTVDLDHCLRSAFLFHYKFHAILLTLFLV